jgi:hypothetical protein
MEVISWGAELSLAVLFLLTGWAALTLAPPAWGTAALIALTVVFFAIAWLVSLFGAAVLALAVGTLARWVYRQSRAVCPAGLYRWL